MDRFFERYNLLNLTQGETDNLNRPINVYLKNQAHKYNNLPKKKAPGPGNFIGELYQMCKKEMVPIL